MIELAGGQRNALIEHGGNHIDKGHTSDDPAIVLGRDVGHGAHQQTAGTASFSEHLVFRAVLFAQQERRDIDEVRERIALVLQATIFKPATSQFLTTTNMGQRNDKAAI